MKVFDEYARYYDLLYKDKNYRVESDFIISLLNDYSSKNATILELGCGTGIHAQMIAEAGYRVHGIDLSESMLRLAHARKQESSLDLQARLEFNAGDVRTYNSGKTFDVVLSLFHVFSYQVTNDDLNAVLETAARHLKSGGVCVFDYWYGPAVLAQRPETRVKRLDDGGMSILRIAESSLDEQQNTVDVHYETHIKSNIGESVIREIHRMRYLFLQEINLLANLHGFIPLCHREWLGNGLPSASTWSAFSVLRKQ